MRRLLVAVVLIVVASASWSACGARSGLEVDSVEGTRPDASLPDAGFDAGRPVVRPGCLEALPPGTLRGVVPEVHSRVAIGAEEHLYSAREIDDEWFGISFDACLTPRWEVRLEGLERSNRVDVMVAPDGDVWFIGRGEPGFARLSADGDQGPVELTFEGGLDTWLGLRAAGPVFSSFLSSDEKYLNVIDGPTTSTVSLATPSSFVWDEECALFGDVNACWNVAYRGTEQLWIRETPRLLDGGLRHITPPAFDGARMWAVRYGISTYGLVALNVQTGSEELSVGFMNTTAGQTELLLGPPVITRAGSVVVYAHGSGNPGALRQHDSEGAEEWTFPAPRARRSSPAGGAVFSNETTHLIGAGGIIYLGMGNTLYALDPDGSMRWRLDDLGEEREDVNEPGINLSRFGDIYLRDSADVLYAVASESEGLAPTPWPIPRGNARLNRAR